MELKLPNIVQFAIPFFILFVVLEVLAWRRGSRVRYETRDTAASLVMGVGNIVHGVFRGLLFGGLFWWVWEHRIFDLGTEWWVFPIALVVNDFIYYWNHRLGHEHRWFWAAHIVHHSSQHYNLSTALRQTWSSSINGLFVLSLPAVFLGIHPAIYAFAGGINLVYQFWIHTEAVDRLGPLEWVLNTPSHHRVHHGNNPRYLDANYGGIFIVWDRLFGTFVAEDREDPPRYGLVHQLNTFNPLRIAFHEYVDIFRDVAKARSLREVWGYVFGPPGWTPDGSRLTADDLKRSWEERLIVSTRRID
ncbi:MAG: sterol desaturase family protein [Myxococcota bacterium]